MSGGFKVPCLRCDAPWVLEEMGDDEVAVLFDEVFEVDWDEESVGAEGDGFTGWEISEFHGVGSDFREGCVVGFVHEDVDGGVEVAEEPEEIAGWIPVGRVEEFVVFGFLDGGFEFFGRFGEVEERDCFAGERLVDGDRREPFSESGFEAFHGCLSFPADWESLGATLPQSIALFSDFVIIKPTITK